MKRTPTLRANELGEVGASVYRKMRRVNGDVFLLPPPSKKRSERRAHLFYDLWLSRKGPNKKSWPPRERHFCIAGPFRRNQKNGPKVYGRGSLSPPEKKFADMLSFPGFPRVPNIFGCKACRNSIEQLNAQSIAQLENLMKIEAFCSFHEISKIY